MSKMESKLSNFGTSIFATMSGMSLKYNAVNLSQGFPNFASDPELIELVNKHMVEGKNQYAPMPGILQLRQALSRKIKSLYGKSVDAEKEITITAGATQGIYNILNAVVHPKDEVIVFEPAYDSYVPGILLSGGVPVSVPILGPDYKMPWEQVERAITTRTKLIIVTNPHNPLGIVLSEDDIKQIRHLQSKYGFFILWDEVYEHIIFDGQEHLSVLKYPDLFENSFAVYSFGKTFHNTGWKMGYVVAPERLTNEFRKVHQFSVFSVNTPIQFALSEYLEQESRYLSLPDFFQKKRDFLHDILVETPLVPLSCKGSYFMLADYSKFSHEDDMTVASKLTKEIGVATIPLSPFYSEEVDSKVLRICFSKTNETLLQAGERLKKIPELF